MKTVTYYAAACDASGKIGQLLVVRQDGRQTSQTWTGVTYPSIKAATADLTRLNCRKDA